MIRLAARVAAAAALLAAAALACAQDGLRITGQINTALVERTLSVPGAAPVHTLTMDSTDTKLLVRESEDLGDGYGASFFMVMGFRADSGGGSVCRRDCWLALRSPFGSLRMGHALPIYDDVSMPWYFLEAAGNHNPAALWANCGNGGGPTDGCFDVYLSRTLRYDSPRWRGLSFSTSLSDPSPELPEASHHARVRTLGGQYHSEALYLGAAHQHSHDVRNAGTDDHATTLSLQYRGWVTIGLGLERLRYQGPEGTLARSYAGVMVCRTVGQHTAWVNLGGAGSGEGSAPEGTQVNAVVRAPASGAHMLTLGYRYRFSPHTQVFAYWNEIVNQRNGHYSFDPPAPEQGGVRIAAWAWGLSQSF
jgi:predicted porin